MSDPLARVAGVLRADGGLLAAATGGPGGATPHGDRAGAARAFAVEAIREGHLLHHGGARVVATDDADLALLAGDRLYALGLADLAAAGDLEAVRAMAEVIAASAAALAAGDGAGGGSGLGPQGLAGLAAPGGATRNSPTDRIPAPSPLLITLPKDRRQTKSKYTADRQMPGAFEGETVTRRRFMTGSRARRGRRRRGRVRAAGDRLRPRARSSRSTRPRGRTSARSTTSPTTATSR